MVYAAGGGDRRDAAHEGSEEARSAFGFAPAFAAADPVAYGADLHLGVGVAPAPATARGEEVCVLEVLADRNGGRIGRWGEFAVDGRFRLTR